MITYRHDGLMPFRVTVKLDGKVVGHILRPHRDEYRYKPLGAKWGDAFDTLEAVQASLEPVQ